MRERCPKKGAGLVDDLRSEHICPGPLCGLRQVDAGRQGAPLRGCRQRRRLRRRLLSSITPAHRVFVGGRWEWLSPATFPGLRCGRSVPGLS